MLSISSTLGKMAAVFGGLLLLGSPAAFAQSAAPKSTIEKTEAAPPSMGETKRPEKKLSLSDVTSVTTEEAARSAAKESAPSISKKQDDKSLDAGIDSVLEFHAASQDEHAAAQSDAKPSVKDPKKNIHGEAYGGMDPHSQGTHHAGGAMGASSKSGKTSVYVQGEQTRSTQPHD
jgi:hypothetical protein